MTFRAPNLILSARNSPGARFPAGYTFCGAPVWRAEYSGTLSASAGVRTTLYSGVSPLTVIAVRGWIMGTDGLQRTLSHAAIAVDNTAFTQPLVMVAVDRATPSTTHIIPGGWGGDPFFLSAKFKLQLDWIER